MKAKEARAIADKQPTISLDEVLGFVKLKAEAGFYKMTIYNAISDNVISELTKLGYHISTIQKATLIQW